MISGPRSYGSESLSLGEVYGSSKPGARAGSRSRGRTGGLGAPFRFFDNRQKYLQFVNTCDEKQVIASRVLTDARLVRPLPPALRIFDAGMGDATVLTRVMRQLHHRHPTVPLLVVGKETSQEDVRISLRKMPDRFQEHPQTVLVVTNMFYSEAPGLRPRSISMQARLNWV